MILLPVLGIDVSKRTLDVHLGEQPGKAFHLRCRNDAAGFEQLALWLQTRGISRVHACLEATGTYSDAITSCLQTAGHHVSVIDPAKLHAFRKSEGRAHKTDRLDAWLLALYAQQKRPEATAQESPSQRQLRGDLAEHEHLLALVQQERNRLENQRLDAHTREHIERRISWLQQEADTWWDGILPRLQASWNQEHPAAQKQPIDPAVRAALPARKKPTGIAPVDCLMTVKGMGLLSALRLFAIIGDGSRFADARHLAAFLGVTPISKESGTSVHGKPMIRRRGHAQGRRWLYMPALTAVRWNPDLKRWAEHLKASHHAPKAITIAVMNKLARVLYALLTTGHPYDAAKAFPAYHRSAPPPSLPLVA